MKKIFLVLAMVFLLSAALITLAITSEPIKDPVCGMTVDPATSEFKVESPHGLIYFCSSSCLEKFQANPAAYVKASSAEKEAAKSGCANCEKRKSTVTAATTQTEEGCDGNCGKTRVEAVNEFHALMMPLESGDVVLIKSAIHELVARKEAVLKAECPDGVCSESYKATRADFGAKVEALAAAVKSGDDSAVAAAFKEMHHAYEALDVLAR